LLWRSLSRSPQLMGLHKGGKTVARVGLLPGRGGQPHQSPPRVESPIGAPERTLPHCAPRRAAMDG
jgi:hypothetical protein